MEKFFKTIFILFFLLSCSKEKNRFTKDNIIEININKNSSAKELCFLNFAKDYYFVALESSSESFLSGINRIFELDEKIIIFDDRYNKVLVFSDNGKFINRIGKIGNGPGEFTDITDISIDFKKKIIQVLDINKRKVLKYKLNGKYIGFSEISTQAYKFRILNSNYTGFFTGYFGGDFYNFRVVDNKMRTKLKLFEYPKNPKEDLMKFSFTGHVTSFKNNFLYSDALSSNIFSIDPATHKIKKKYTVVFNSNSWPENKRFLHQTFFKKIQTGQLNFLRNNFEENEKAIVFCYNIANNDIISKGVNLPKVGFYLKSQQETFSHVNFKNDISYKYLSSVKGKSQNDEYFIFTVDDFKKILKNNNCIAKNEQNNRFNIKYIDEETTVLLYFSFK